MSKLHLNRDRQNLGQFTPEDVSQGLASGRFFPTDLAWRDGMESWQPLSTFTDLPPVEAEIESPPIPVVHAPDSSGESFPWDRRAEIGFFAALGATISQSTTRPTGAFQRLGSLPGMVAPYGFYLLLALASFAIYTAEIFSTFNYVVSTLATNSDIAGNPAALKALAQIKDGGPVGFALFLLTVVPGLPFFFAGLYHLLLMLFGGARESFLKTFAVVCYVFGSLSPLVIVPCCGPLAMAIWGLIATGLGLAAAHRTDSWRTTLAVVVPFLFCCGGYLLLILRDVGSYAAAGSGMH